MANQNAKLLKGLHLGNIRISSNGLSSTWDFWGFAEVLAVLLSNRNNSTKKEAPNIFGNDCFRKNRSADVRYDTVVSYKYKLFDDLTNNHNNRQLIFSCDHSIQWYRGAVI